MDGFHFEKKLARIVGKAHVHTAPEVLATYECDGCVLMKQRPDAVVLPKSTQEVAAVVTLCRAHGVPFIARGAGTGLSGGTLPVEGGVFIGVSRMNRIVEVDVANRLAVVEAGVVNAWINKEVRPYNLFFAPDPSSQGASTIGGNIAENAGGIHCIKYGVTVDHILGLEVVTPEGDIVTLGGRHGQYGDTNWIGLMVGSEGTFGIVTQATVKLTPLPLCTKVFLAAFCALEDAGGAVMEIIGQGLQPAALEFMDDVTVRAVNAAFQVGFPEDAVAVLLIELDGPQIEVEITEERLLAILQHHHVSQLQTAQDEAERMKLWRARKLAVAAYGRILPAFYVHDCVIPRSELIHLLQKIQAIGKKYDIIIGNVFHAGDGNLHPNIILDPQDADMVRRVMAGGDEILRACLDVGGVLSGEHGIGVEKNEYMTAMFTPQELTVMQRLKPVFDPDNLCNPGKIFPSRAGCGETHPSSPDTPRRMIQAGGVWI